MDRRNLLKDSARYLVGALAINGCGFDRERQEHLHSVTATMRRDLKIQGRLFWPDSDEYSKQKLCYNKRFDYINPKLIAEPRNHRDLAEILRWSRQANLGIAVRAGGHSYIGSCLSRDVVISMSGFDQISIDRDKNTITVGTGMRAAPALRALTDSGFAIPTGSCPTVGLSGLTLGGGYGLASRHWGLTCDRLLSAEVVTTDGSSLLCHERKNSDLFWGLRGAGRYLCIPTKLKFRINEAPQVTNFELVFAWNQADKALLAWQAWAPEMDSRLVAVCHVIGTSSTRKIVIKGQFLGPKNRLEALIVEFLSSFPLDSQPRYFEQNFWQSVLHWAGCGPDVNSCNPRHLNPSGGVKRAAMMAKSHLFQRSIDTEGINALLEGIERRSKIPGGWGGVLFDPYGGIIRNLNHGDTAFTHRKMRFMAQYIGYYDTEDSSFSLQTRNWLEDTYATVNSFASSHAYQNYPDDRLAQPTLAYYQDHLPKLRKLKSSVDPDQRLPRL